MTGEPRKLHDFPIGEDIQGSQGQSLGFLKDPENNFKEEVLVTYMGSRPEVNLD